MNNLKFFLLGFMLWSGQVMLKALTLVNLLF